MENKGLTVGVGGMGITSPAYAMILRLVAENVMMSRILRRVREAFPDEEIVYAHIRRIKHTRKAEVAELRQRLNSELDDLWIANKRQRLLGLQQIYEDANRWVPDKVIVPGTSGGPSVISYRKSTDTMLKALKQARDELGETAEHQQANALERLAAAAESERGLERTIDVTEAPDFETVPELRDARLLEIEAEVRSAGADEGMGFLDGGESHANAAAQHLLTPHAEAEDVDEEILLEDDDEFELD